MLGISNHDGGGESHASLSGGAESGSDQLVDGVFLVGVGHDDAVVLGTHVALDTLAVGGTAVENVVPGFVST